MHRARPTASDFQVLALIGRDDEMRRLDAMLDSLGGVGQSSRALVVSGDAGIGKSALLQHLRGGAEAAGLQILSAVGVESEAELAFAGLHQLLGPILGLSDHLPDPRRHALEAAFGITAAHVPNRFHVALAAHQLVSETASSRPLVLLVDDAHWLDSSSLDVLTFLARRLENEPIALLATLRDGYPSSIDKERLPRLRLQRLRASEAAELLDRSAPGLHPIRRAGLLAEAAGNPLALVELGGVSRPTDRRERLEPQPATLTARLEHAFAARLDDLPKETRLALLAGALDGRASLEEIVRSTAELHGGPVELSALDAASAAGLVEMAQGKLSFHHPLMRSAVRQAASPAQVLAMYSALARVVGDPERSVWHRAMAAGEVDEEIASALEAQAATARGRGAVGAAAAALERAAALTADPRLKGERLLGAAEIAYELGLTEVAGRMVDEAQQLGLGAPEAARLAWLRQMISGDVWREAGATKVFVTIARELADSGDAEMALRSLIPIAHRCWWTPTRAKTRSYLVEAAIAIGLPDDDPRLLEVIALADPEVTGSRVRSQIAGKRLHETVDPSAAMQIGVAAEKAGDMVTGEAFLSRSLAGLHDQGRLGMLAQALVHHAWVAIHTGDWEAAIRHGAEGATLARDTQQPQFGVTGEFVAALAAALRGENVETMLAAPEHRLLAAGAGPLLAPAYLARGAMAAGEGRYEDAFRHLLPVFDEAAPAFHRFMRWSGVLDLVEAGGRGEHAGRVAEIVDELERVGRESGAPILLAGLACARPLLASEGQAEVLFERALADDTAGYPFLRGRMLFSYGRWLRRQRRDADAREPLRAAIESFDVLGAASWSRRARQQLRATGERLGPRTPEARDRLTPQELQIAELAAEGLSNRQIGERLFLSHRTIGSHLYRIFPKLEITARSQLRDALATASEEDTEAVA
jgi:DNA-binding CsgD family transcriptional regulator